MATNRIGEDVAGSSREGGDVASSSRGGGDVASSSRGGGDVASSSNTAEEGPMFWTRELDRHYLGSFSTAVMQANRNLEDYSQVEVGRKSTFVGVYDGHGPGGHEVGEHVRDKFTEYLMGHVTDTSTMSGDVLRYAFERTEQSWLNIVNTRFARDPYVAARGTCCLVGVIWRGNLHVANVGDSRAILGSEVEGSDKIGVQQLTRDYNVRDSVVRAELMREHGDEPDFIVEDESAKGVFRIKGRIQVSKSIGDAYLKIPRFNLDRVDKKFVLNTPIREGKPALSAVPITSTRPIEPQDRFVIFASDGLWDLMSNQEVADFVHQSPKEGIAHRLIEHGTKLAVKAGSSYKDMHDITVVVVFFDHALQPGAVEFSQYSITNGPLCLKGDSQFTTVLDDVGLSSPNLRTVWVSKLPYSTTRNELYSLIRNTTGGAVERMELAPYGFSVSITFYELQKALDFIAFHKNTLILKGRLCCVSLMGELRYCRLFQMLDRVLAQMYLPYTLFVGGLADDETAESLSLFFSSRGILLREEPLIQVSRRGNLYAYVTFLTIEGTNQARQLAGTQHRGIPIRIRYREDPVLHFRQHDLLPDLHRE